MTERPIILRADEVRAALAGTQTQVRRPVNVTHVQYLGGAPETSDPADWGYWVDDEYGRWAVLARGVRERMHNGHVSIPCPLGQPGDRLWVRETWAALEPAASEETAREHMDRVLSGPDGLTLALWYRADGEMPVVDQLFADDGDAIRWRSPVTMPRWASRITLEIADVGVERAAGEWVWVVTFRRLGAEEVLP